MPTSFCTSSLYQAIVSVFYIQYFLSTKQMCEAGVTLILQRRELRQRWNNFAKISQLIREEEDLELSSNSQHAHACCILLLYLGE